MLRCPTAEDIAIDIVDSRLEFAKTLGATHTINSKDEDEDAVARIRDITGGGVTKPNPALNAGAAAPRYVLKCSGCNATTVGPD